MYRLKEWQKWGKVKFFYTLKKNRFKKKEYFQRVFIKESRKDNKKEKTLRESEKSEESTEKISKENYNTKNGKEMVESALSVCVQDSR